MPDNIDSILGVQPENPEAPGTVTEDPGQTIVEPGLWSFQGRIGRGSFWARMLMLTGVGLVVGFILGALASASRDAPIFVLILLLASEVFAVWFSLATQVKRWHDMDKSGWMVLLNFTIIALPVVVIILGCIRGTTGPNRFGPDTLPQPGVFSGSIAS